jgi:hypothetical protein
MPQYIEAEREAKAEPYISVQIPPLVPLVLSRVHEQKKASDDQAAMNIIQGLSPLY